MFVSPTFYSEKLRLIDEGNEYIRNIHCDKAENGQSVCFLMKNYLNCDLVRCPPSFEQWTKGYRHRKEVTVNVKWLHKWLASSRL
jgi:hypothetical protein